MGTLGKILIKISVSLVLIYQIAYILNIYLTIKYKIEMMNTAEDILITTYDKAKLKIVEQKQATFGFSVSISHSAMPSTSHRIFKEDYEIGKGIQFFSLAIYFS